MVSKIEILEKLLKYYYPVAVAQVEVASELDGNFLELIISLFLIQSRYVSFSGTLSLLQNFNFIPTYREHCRRECYRKKTFKKFLKKSEGLGKLRQLLHK